MLSMPVKETHLLKMHLCLKWEIMHSALSCSMRKNGPCDKFIKTIDSAVNSLDTLAANAVSEVCTDSNGVASNNFTDAK